MEACEVLVVGGGVTGLGITRALARRGIKVVLLEKDKLGAATSDQSLRVMHGGFRYLVKGDIPRLWRSMLAQTELLHSYPDLVTPLPCVMPLSGKGFEKRISVWLGARFFDTFRLAAKSPLSSAKVLSQRQLEAIVPLFRNYHGYSCGGLLWHDALLSSHFELIQRIKEECQTSGAIIEENCKALTIEGHGLYAITSTTRGKIAARLVINASGGHHSSLSFNDQSCFQNISWVRAFNIILNRPLVSSHAIGLPAPSGRLFFLVPRTVVATKLQEETSSQINHTAIGTGYVSLERAEASELLSEEDIEPFMLELESALPEGTLTDSDEFTVEWGILPREPKSKIPLPINKARINWISDYYLEIIAAKYTTFLSFGVAVAKQVLKRLRK